MPRAQRIRLKMARLLGKIGFPRDWFLIPLAACIGVLAGLVAMGFNWMVRSSDTFFFQRLGASSWLEGSVLVLVLLPALGGLAVGLIQRYLARQSAGHGIPDVIEALARRGGTMPGRVGVFRAVTAALTLGSGGSAGVEGPIVHIGSVLGSLIGQAINVGREHMHTLVGCGAAAGLAAIFNAPIAGVIFVLEVMLRDFSLRTFMPIVIASVFGTSVTQALFDHNQAIFSVPAELSLVATIEPSDLAACVLLGLMCGLTGALFMRCLRTTEALFQRVRIPTALKPALGGALLGLTGVAFRLAFEHPFDNYGPPPFMGNGYPVIERLFEPSAYAGMHLSIVMLAMVVAGKMIGTGLTLGSGGSGGIFAPSLFMGAALGAMVGLAMQQFGWAESTGRMPAILALVGMAGLLAATVHCPMTAFLMVFEVTRDYRFILPVMLVAILATVVSQAISRDSVYTRVLREMGVRVGTMSDLTVLRRITAARVPLVPPVTVSPDAPAERLMDIAAVQPVNDFIVRDDEGGYLGMVVGADLRAALLDREAMPLLVVADLLNTSLPLVHPDETLDAVLDKFSLNDVAGLPVIAPQTRQLLGMITRSALMRTYQQALDEVSGIG